LETYLEDFSPPGGAIKMIVWELTYILIMNKEYNHFDRVSY
jgi:hypothetical protein